MTQQYRRWTPEELQRGYQFYRDHTVEETAAFLGRPISSVANAFFRHGIMKTKEEKRKSKRYSRSRFRAQRDDLAMALRYAGIYLKNSDTATAKRIIKDAIDRLDSFDNFD